MSWSNIEAVLTEDNAINVNDVLNEMNEDLDYRERVVNMSIQYGFMIVCTISQCYVYNIVTQNWGSPFVFDVKDSIYMIV